MYLTWLCRISLLVSFALVPAGLLAQEQNEAADLAARFGARAKILDISLSPSGDRIAYITSDNRTTEVIYVAELDGSSEPRAVTLMSEPDAELTHCDWVNEDWLVCEAYGISKADNVVPIYFTRLLAVAADGSGTNVLTSSGGMRAYGLQQDGGSVLALDIEGEDNRILMTRDFRP